MLFTDFPNQLEFPPAFPGIAEIKHRGGPQGQASRIKTECSMKSGCQGISTKMERASGNLWEQ